jgi:hypothetical protein
VTLPKGTWVDLVAHYDNSAGNKANPDPTRDVTFGEQSTDEMLFGVSLGTAMPFSSGWMPDSAPTRLSLLT